MQRLFRLDLSPRLCHHPPALKCVSPPADFNRGCGMVHQLLSELNQRERRERGRAAKKYRTRGGG